ncbi:hypothetical protein UA08_03702 [Talaromyces atroroseus]|uniref:Peptidase M20 domain-containing protein 2 n=1 Tax=Talaromyces atroroseus TaxID=1441469 RepID=A0A225B647_TALAT|nr:hypothetical protein UA08_03702 [Talaromyces atroroseus]OKL61377.1 hypothetical protein UA08_03702 [Talaromyces atroroseus]
MPKAVSTEEVKAPADAVVDQLRAKLGLVNKQIWSNPETAYEEHNIHDALCDFLENEGFQVTRHALGIGHACGHNLIASSSIAAFIALSTVLKRFGMPGRTQLLGTPAEENGGGKAKLIENGAYQRADVSLMGHAGPTRIFPELESDGIAGLLVNARKEFTCEFIGKSAHAGGNPWTRLNALDALVTSYNNVAVLRQQIQPDDRIHCAFLDTPKDLVPRVRNCIEAAALATGCKVNLMEDQLYADIEINETLCERYQFHMSKYGRNVTKNFPKFLAGSSNVGNVSYIMPTIHPMFSIHAPDGSFPHNPSFETAPGTDVAFEEALVVGKLLALIGWDVLTDNDLLQRAKYQWKQATSENQTVSRHLGSNTLSDLL